LLLAAFAGSQAAAENSSFIIREGTLFKTADTNRPWFYAGTNNYYAGIDCYDPAAAEEIIADMVKMNLNVLRLWGFNDDQSKSTKLQGPNAGDFNESNFQKLDYMLHIANLSNIRVILPLTNYWDDYGGMKQYVSWAGDGTPTGEEFYTNSTAKTYYKNYVTYIANRVNTYNGRVYKNDPTILAWQVANEPEYEGDATVGDGSELTNWINDIANHLKNVIGAGQLVATGMEGFYDTGNSTKGGFSWMDNKGTCFIIQHADSNIDLAGFHIYQDWWSTSDSQSIQWIVYHIRDGRRHASLQKPVVLDEYGRRVPENTMEVRNEAFKRYLRLAYRELANGANFWILYHDAYEDYDHFGVYYPNDVNTIEIITKYSDKIKFLNQTGIHQLVAFDYNDDEFTKTQLDGAVIYDISRVQSPCWYLTNDGSLKINCKFTVSGDRMLIGAEMKDPITAAVGIDVSDYGYNYLVARVMAEPGRDFQPGSLSIKLYDKTGGGVSANSLPIDINQAGEWYEIAWPAGDAGTLASLEEVGLDITANAAYEGNIYLDFLGGDLTDLSDNLLPQVFTVALEDACASASSYRWMDVADQLYSSSYQGSYAYGQADVQLSYYTQDTTLHGTLAAQNLKPNFAYQVKLEGIPEQDPVANENIGLAGRWWQQEWNDTTGVWANGQNLNNKGDGSSPNPNDELYFLRRDIIDGNSPTGKKYRFSGYMVFDYFITDESGSATVQLNTDSSYHVLWKTTQRAPTADDGPVKTASFDVSLPDPAGAYDVNYPSQAVSIFGEWERLPAGDVKLRPGMYNIKLVLTEESFHGGGLAGGWAAAMGQSIGLSIIPAAGDLDWDGHVNWTDLDILAEYWLGSGGGIQGDLNEDNIVNFKDFAQMMANWCG